VSSRAKIPGGALSAQVTLGQAKLTRGSDGELLLHVGIDAADAGAKARRPIDFALVLDVSGSMEDDNKIGLLKRATKGLLEKLGPEDRVALVSFSTDAHTVFPLGAIDAASRSRYAAAVDALEARGGTNISGGLLAGADELRKAEARPGSARRIVLMTDGFANFGVQDPGELTKLVNGLAHEGFTISTVGLGAEYRENLLTDMADAGGGGFYHADGADKLARIYEVEVDATRALVARNAKLVIDPAAGVSVDQVYLWTTSITKDGQSFVSLGDLSGGRHTKAVARLHVPTGVPSSLAVASVSLQYEDVRGKHAETVLTGSVTVGVEVVADDAVARASTAEEIRGELDKVAIAVGMKEAHDAALIGDEAKARTALLAVEKRLGGKIWSWTNTDGTSCSIDITEVAAVASRVARTGSLSLDDAAFCKLPNNGEIPTGK
jgi:Ca-activated chloride channel family protein